MSRELFATAKKGQLDDERTRHDLATEALDEIDDGLGGASRGKQIVGDENPMTRSDGVFVDFQDVGAVLEIVFDTLGLGRKLPGLPNRHETGAESVRQRWSENESPGLHPDDRVDALRFGTDHLGETVDGGTQPVRVLEKGRDVIEQDARLRKVGNLADQLLQVVHGRSLLLISWNGVKTLASGWDERMLGDVVDASDTRTPSELVAEFIEVGGLSLSNGFDRTVGHVPDGADDSMSRRSLTREIAKPDALDTSGNDELASGDHEVPVKSEKAPTTFP